MTQNKLTKERPKTAHKGNFGHVLILGGNYGMPGAPTLVAKGASLMGAGLVTVATRRLHVPVVASTHPEALCYAIECTNYQKLRMLLTRASVIIIGPGLGQSFWSRFLLHQTILHIKHHKKPCLFDADALNLLSKKPQKTSLLQYLPNCIYTPHPGEAAHLLQTTTKDIQSDREQSIFKLQKLLGGVVVLKGSNTLTYAKNHEIACCKHGNPAMATGGMGDLLSGIIGGLITQGLTPMEAAVLGVNLHAKAGDNALKKLGGPSLIASNLLPELKPLLNA